MKNNPYAWMLLEIWAWVSCWLWNIAHNAIAHPLIPFLPEALSNSIHDWTAKHWTAAISRKQFGSLYYGDDDVF